METTEMPPEEVPPLPPVQPGEEQPTWPQGEDYDPREDPGPPRPEDEPQDE